MNHKHDVQAAHKTAGMTGYDDYHLHDDLVEIVQSHMGPAWIYGLPW